MARCCRNRCGRFLESDHFFGAGVIVATGEPFVASRGYYL